MPKLRQPIQLQKLCLDHLLKYVVDRCDQLSVAGSLEKLSEAISFIKTELCASMPWFFVADFCDSFLDQFHADDRSDSHNSAALELITDKEIVGLRCRGRIVRFLDGNNGHRLRELKELDLTGSRSYLGIRLEDFYLDKLTTFIFTRDCTDRHIEVIVRNCPNLQVLRVPHSWAITEKGIQALGSCTELRIADFSECRFSPRDINLFLSSHKKINELTCSEYLPDSSTSVCPAMDQLCLEVSDEPPTPANMHAIVTKFPNLKYLELKGVMPEDLMVLKSLDKLAGLSIYFCGRTFFDEVEPIWQNIKELLKFIGKNMTSLKLTCWDQGFFWRQEEIDFIFQYCPNVEHLKFDHGDGLVVIPPFPKLKELVPNIAIEFESIEILSDPTIEFDELVELETLWLHNFEVNSELIKSIMFDSVKFPKLSVVKTICMKPEELAEIERVARSHNLDFRVDNDPETNWYVEYRFGPKSDDEEINGE